MRLEFPRKLTGLITLTDIKGVSTAVVGGEGGEVWQTGILPGGKTIHTIETNPSGKAKHQIFSFTSHRKRLLYSPLGDSSIHCYHLSKKNLSFLRKNNYTHVARVALFKYKRKEYYALGYTDQEKDVSLLSFYDRREHFVLGVEEVDGSVQALDTLYTKEGETIILAGTEKSTLYAVDCRGTVKWKFKTESAINCMEVSYRPGTKEPYIFIGVEGGTLYLLDSSGVMKWKKVFNAAIRDCRLLTISESDYPHIIVGLSDNTIHSFCRSSAEDLAPLLSDLFSDILKKEKCSKESLIEQFIRSDFQSIRDFGEIRSMGFDNASALLILQFTHLGRPLEEIIEIIMSHKPSARSLSLLAAFRLNYEKRASAHDIKLRKRFEILYQRGDLKDALLTGCQLAYQSSDMQWTTQLPHPIDNLIVVDSNRFLTIAEKAITLFDRLMPSKDTQITLPAKITACFSARGNGYSDHGTTFLFFTKDFTIHYGHLPLSEVRTIVLQGHENITGEIREKSVALMDNLFSFSTTDKTCYIYSLSSNKAHLIKQFTNAYQTTAATFCVQGNDMRIVLGTRDGKILVYHISKGDIFTTNEKEPIWSGEIEGMVECIVAAKTSRGETLIIAGSASGATKGFDFEGNLLWEFRTITEKLQPGRGLRSIITVGGHGTTTMYVFLLAGEIIYVLNEEGKLTKIFTLPEIALRCDLVEASGKEHHSLVVLSTTYRLTHTTYYLKNPLAHELVTVYKALITPAGEERSVMELIETHNPYVQAFAFQQATHLTQSYTSVKDVVLSSMKYLYQYDNTLRRVIIKSLEHILTERWDPTLLLDNIDFDDLYQFSGMLSLLNKVGKSGKARRDNVITLLKTVYSITKREANHIAILQLLEELLKDDPQGIAQFLFDITPFENSHWVSQEIGIILGRTLGTSYAENFNLLTKCFYVASVKELKALSSEIKNNLTLYEGKFTENGIRALRLFSAIDWNKKERMDDPFTTELEQLKTVLTGQSYTIATALFHKWERILKKVSTAEIALSDLSVKAWHTVENLNSHVRHSIVEGCFSGLESFSLMLKENYSDQDIIKGITSSIKQLPMVRKTLTDYFDSSIDGDVRLKDVFFFQYKTIFKELDEIEQLSTHFKNNLNDTSFRDHFAQIIPEKTRNIQRDNLARIDHAVKRLKTDVCAILENLFQDNLIKQSLHKASISVHLNLAPLDSSHCKILAREHELFNAFYELTNNVIKHDFEEMHDERERTITVATECYSKENLYLKIDITDNGIGMSPHELARMRDISFTKGGTGEGMERVFQLIEHNRGEISYHSKKGSGTTISISLPLKIRKEIPEQ
jgi:outer membrane protein assembly factor BamB/anti-sigma regulatory factor (Ser/Thr protein kinase)